MPRIKKMKHGRKGAAIGRSGKYAYFGGKGKKTTRMKKGF